MKKVRGTVNIYNNW